MPERPALEVAPEPHALLKARLAGVAFLLSIAAGVVLQVLARGRFGHLAAIV